MVTLREAAAAVMEQLKHGWVEESDPVVQDLKAALVEDALQHFTDVSQEIEAALAEPTVPSDCTDSHQPMAWMNTEDGFCTLDAPVDGIDVMSQWVPLYLAPPQRKPLTDGDIEKIAAPYYGTMGFRVETFARAIERAHGIGGQP